MTKIGVLIPSTTNMRDWNCITDTYLYKSIISFVSKSNSDYSYKFYIGIDKDDKIYSDKSQRRKIYDLCSTWNHINIQFYPVEETQAPKGHVTIIWNILYKKAIEEHCDYFWACGDDIIYCDDGWLEDCIQELKKTKHLGTAGTYNGNGRIITQFLVTQTHYAIFNRLFPPQIRNWYCDDYMNELYSPNFLHIVNKRCINAGGEPRYKVQQAPFYKDLVKEDKIKLLSFIKTNGGYNHYRGIKGRGKGSKSSKPT